MLSVSLSSIATISGGQLHGSDQTIRSVTIDSRKTGEQALFVALSGERVDGHDFVAAAAANGAVAALVQHPVDAAISQLQVADCSKVMAQMAAAYRDGFAGKIIAVTGSSGKTTTRSMLTAILVKAGIVSATQGNLNNDLGVPLTVLAADNQADFWVVEMGAAQQGDIARLMQIVRPDISVITNVGNAHVGRFGSEANIAQGKAEIYQGLAAEGTAVINADDAYAGQWQAIHNGNTLRYSADGKSADVFAVDIQLSATASLFTLCYQQQRVAVRLPVAGLHNVRNALCAAACAVAAGVSLVQIAEGLSVFTAVQGRLQETQAANGARVIDDSYNANPASVKAAIDVLAMQPGRRFLVLGDMAELGENVSQYHVQIGDYARQQGIDVLLACGVETQHSCKAFGETARHFASKQQLLDYLLAASGKNDVILIKGSRSAGMDEVVRGLEQKAIA